MPPLLVVVFVVVRLHGNFEEEKKHTHTHMHARTHFKWEEPSTQN